MQQIAHIFHLVEQKYNYTLEKDPTWATHVPYLNHLQHDLVDIENNITANNSAELEDKLGGILRDLCNVMYTLQKEGYIESVHNVMERALETYEERLTGVKEGVDWETTKGIQKERLFQEQVLKNK